MKDDADSLTHQGEIFLKQLRRSRIFSAFIQFSVASVIIVTMLMMLSMSIGKR